MREGPAGNASASPPPGGGGGVAERITSPSPSSSSSSPAPAPSSPSATLRSSPLRVGVLLGSDADVLRVARRNCVAIRHGLSGCRLAAVAFGGGDGFPGSGGDPVMAREKRRAVGEFLTHYVRGGGGGEEEEVAVFEGEGAYEDLLEKGGVDAVYVPLPARHHKEWTLRSIRSGRHVLVEHPAGLCASDYAEMLSAAYRRGKYLKEGTVFLHRHRTDEFLRVVRDERRVGTVDRVNCDLTCPDGWFRREGRFECDEVLPVDGGGGGIGGGGDAVVEADPMGCIGTLGWYCVRMAVVVFSALGSGRAVDARVVHVRRRGGSSEGSPIDATCLITFERERTLSFHCGYRHGLRQRVEACGSKISASMADFVWPRRKSTVVGVGGTFLLHAHDSDEEEERCNKKTAGGGNGAGGKGGGAAAADRWRTAAGTGEGAAAAAAAENGGGGGSSRGGGRTPPTTVPPPTAAGGPLGSTQPPQEAMMWRTFAMIARGIDDAAERASRAARAAAIAEAKGELGDDDLDCCDSEHGPATDDDEAGGGGGGGGRGGDNKAEGEGRRGDMVNGAANANAVGGWAGRDGLLEEAGKLTDLSLRTQEIMDALLESVRNGCRVVEIA